MKNARLLRLSVILPLTFLMALILGVGTASADVFPLLPDMRGTALPADWQLGGGAYLTAAHGDDLDGEGWLRLTEAAGNRNGYAYYDVAFPSDRGLVVTFDYAAWGGSGADGLTFFLFDGDTATFSPGGFGGSLGYAQRSGIDGLSNGYLGVGIDEFGNYSRGNEGRNGGPGFRRDAIAVRGPGSGSTGYAYIVGTGTLRQGLDFPRIPRRPNQGSDRFRRVEIRLEPGPSGYTVEVYLQSGFNASLEQVIAPTAIGQNPPPTLKMGFTASTGGATNYHEIRNLSVTSTDTPTVLQGTVTESAHGLPMPGAAITVVDAQGHTLAALADASGQWSLSSESTDLAAGTASVTVTFAGYCSATGEVNVAEGVPNTLDLVLDPGVIQGVVSDAATQVPLVGATVTLTDTASLVYSTTTTLGGVFAFESTLAQPMAMGTMGLAARKSGYLAATADALATACGPNDVPLAMDTSDIWFFKSDGRSTASPGEYLTYTLTLENQGSIPAEGIVVVDELWAHEYVTIVSMTPGATQVGHVITWTLPSPLAVDASTSLTLAVRVNDALPEGETVLANYGHAIVTGCPEADVTSNEQSDLTAVTAHPNLTIAKTATTETTPVGVNQLITYTLTGDNRGHALATGVVVTDLLDGLVTYVPGSAVLEVDGGTAPVTVTQTAPDLVFSLPDIPPGMAGDLRYAVETIGSLPSGTQFISNTATVALDQQDGDESNNSDSYQMPAEALVDLFVDKVAIPDPFPARPGGLIVNELRYGNLGTTNAGAREFSDVLPALTSYVPGSLSINGVPASDPPIVGGVMSLTDLTAPASQARYEGVLSYTLRITDALPAHVTEVVNTASCVDALLPEPYVLNNLSSAVTTVEAAPDLSISLDDGLMMVEAGDTLTWTVTFVNHGDQGATNVAISVTLGEGAAYESGSASDAGAYDASSSTVSWDLPVLGVGEPHTYTLRAMVQQTDLAGALAFAEATIADDGANGPEPSLGDNYAVDVDRVVRPYVVLSKTMSEDVAVGQPVSFSIGYRNFSKAPGYDVRITDTLPAYLDFVDASGAWSRVGDDIVWSLGTVGPGAQGSVHMTATLTELPQTLESVLPTLPRELVPMQEAITSTLTGVASPWYAGGSQAPSVRVLWTDAQPLGPIGWNANPRLPGAATFDSWPAPVPAGIETFYWLDEADLGATWIAHDPAGQPAPNYSFFRHLFYLPLNVVQPEVTLDIAADDLAEAYVNGVYVGDDYGAGGATALVDVQGVQPGANLLAVRLLNNDHGGHAVYADPQGRFLCHPGLLYRLELDYDLRPFVMSPPIIRVGETYALDVDEAALAGVPPYILDIDYGEGLSGTSSTTHVYGTSGTYTVTVKATDAHGQVGRDTFTVEVMPAYSHLVVNNAQLAAASSTDVYLSQGGTANTTFLGLEQVLGVEKTLVSQVQQPDGSHRLSYQITISSTRVQIDALPLYDSYDPAQMSLVAADPAPSSQPYPGLAVWDDLTGPAPHGLGRALTADAPMVVSATFVVDPGVSGMITNTAWVDGAQDEAGLSVNDGQANMVLEVARPSAIVSPPAAWGDLGVVCAGWRQRWTLTAYNDGDRVLNHVTLTAAISETLALDQYDVVWDACSAGAIAGGDGEVFWTVPSLAPSETIERDLVLRPYTSVAPGTVVEICASLASDQFASDRACSQSEIGRCDTPTPAPTPSPTPAPGGERPLYLPLIFR